MKIRFTRPADADLTALVDFIAMDSPGSASGLLTRILLTIDKLRKFPGIGRAGVLHDTRELTIRRTSYIVVYRIVADEVIILRVRHAAMSWPPSA